MCRLMKNFVQVKGSKATPAIPIVLVGNKCDEEAGAREVASTTGETLQVRSVEILKYGLQLFKEMWKCTYIETSAKNNFNIEAVFQEILTLEQKRQLSFQVDDDKVNFYYSKNRFIS